MPKFTSHKSSTASGAPLARFCQAVKERADDETIERLAFAAGVSNAETAAEFVKFALTEEQRLAAALAEAEKAATDLPRLEAELSAVQAFQPPTLDQALAKGAKSAELEAARNRAFGASASVEHVRSCLTSLRSYAPELFGQPAGGFLYLVGAPVVNWLMEHDLDATRVNGWATTAPIEQKRGRLVAADR